VVVVEQVVDEFGEVVVGFGGVVDVVEAAQGLLSVNRPSWGRLVRSTTGRVEGRILDEGGRYGTCPRGSEERWSSSRR
jgi:hypothetical protein